MAVSWLGDDTGFLVLYSSSHLEFRGPESDSLLPSQQQPRFDEPLITH